MAFTWTDNQTLLSARVLARGSSKRAVLDLSAVYEAQLFCRIGRSDATALAATAGVAGVSLQIRELFNGATKKHPGGARNRSSGFAAAVVGLVNFAAGYVAGTSTFVVDGTSLVPAAGAEQYLCLWGTATNPNTLADDAALTNAEFAKWSKGSATSLTLDSPAEYARIDNEYITSQADIFAPIRLPGGVQWEIIFDYGDDTSGSNVAIEALYKTLTAIA